MGAKSLSWRGIKGEYYAVLRASKPAWIETLSNLFPTNQPSETIGWLGASPTFRKWVGERVAKGLSEHGVTIVVDEFESTLEFLKRDFTRDKTGQVEVRIREFASRSTQNWAQLFSSLILAGETSTCYDGRPFFDLAHSEDNSGAQSNVLEIADSREGEKPTVAQMQDMVLAAITTIHGFVDGAGEPFLEGSKRFLLMVPNGLWIVATKALKSSIIVDSTQAADNVLVQSADLKVELAINPRLDAWYTDGSAKFVVFRTDAETRPFIRLEEDLGPKKGENGAGNGVSLELFGEGSEHGFKHNKVLAGATARRGVGYGYWQHGVLVHSVDSPG